MLEFLTNVFNTAGFPPRWQCGTWTPGHGWLHVCSDIAIWLAYFTIPGVLLYFTLRRKDLPFNKVFLLFGAFILCCGLTHLMDATIFWWPAYRLSGVLKLLTAAVSWGTVAALLFVMPRAISLRSPEELKREVAARTAELSTANAELRASEGRFQQLADAIPQLAWSAGPDGHIDWYNQRWYEYTGTTLEEMQGWGWKEVHDPDVLPQVLAKWQHSIATGEPFDMVFPLRGADGVFRPFLTRVQPFRDDQGRVVRWFGTNTDISEQQATQEELRKVAARLSETDRRKNEFLATLAHELRNPLAPIRIGLEAMRVAAGDAQAVEDIRTTMERQAEQMVHLVDDLLDVARITRGKLRLRKTHVNLAEILHDAVDTTRPTIVQAGHQLTLRIPETPVTLRADRTRLTQVFSNLLINAAKYTPDGGHLELSAEVDSDRAVITVKDDGFGIPPEKQEHIFEMFGQVDRSLEGGQTGLGIGLTLVRLLVGLHHGNIEVHSAGVDQGSEFRVTLPVVGPHQPSADLENDANRPAADVKTAPLKLLIVDDNEAAAKMLQVVTAALGHDVRLAYDGAAAVTAAAEFRPHVILMDIGMPKMNGYEAAATIRKEVWGADVCLVALTGWGQESDKERTREAGFDQHLVKPANPETLRSLLTAQSRRVAAQENGDAS